MPYVSQQLQSPVSRSGVRMRCRYQAGWCGGPVPTRQNRPVVSARAAPTDPSPDSTQPSNVDVGLGTMSSGPPVDTAGPGPPQGSEPQQIHTPSSKSPGPSESDPHANTGKEVRLAQRPRFANEALLDNWEEFVQAHREEERTAQESGVFSDPDGIWSSFKETLDDTSDDEEEYDDEGFESEGEEAAEPAPEPVPERPGFTSPLQVLPHPPSCHPRQQQYL